MKVFSAYQCVLGESPFWSNFKQQFFWIDIIGKKILSKALSSGGDFDLCIEVEFTPTALIECTIDERKILIVADEGLFLLDTETNSISLYYSLELDRAMRTNDAGVDPSGNLWIGVMERTPSGLNGYVLLLEPDGSIRVVIDQIGIPNSFCWSFELDAMLISDSFQKKTFAVKGSCETSKVNDYPVILDISSTKGTPDGGAIDEKGNFWNANWGLGRVICYDFTGVVRQIDVGTNRVSSLCFGDTNYDKLLVTTAYENITDSEVESEPKSGFSFVIMDLGVKGRKPLGFAMKDFNNAS